MSTFVSTTIPYVNGDPHVGFALECVQADVLARHRRARGEPVRFGTGTDDNALKNVRAAAAAGVPVADFVAARAAPFAELRETLGLSTDDFIRTSADPRHRPGVEALWRACDADLAEREYEGLYCVSCEAFVDGPCAEHGEAERVSERNWFFRLSRYQEPLLELLESGRLRIEPPELRRETLAFVRRGLEDVSVSRSYARAGGWGIPVPGDPTQVVWVWFDALANYVTALGYGSGGNDAYRAWWAEADRRIHVVGKDVARFHAVIWPALLLAAGEPPPTAVFVHGFLTAGGRKLSKSSGADANPRAVVETLGLDAFRWWLVRDVPRAGDTDFRPELVAARGRELAHLVGNLVNRSVALARRVAPAGADPAHPLAVAAAALPGVVDEALDRFDVRAASAAIAELAQAANRHVSETRPWELADEELAAVVPVLLEVCATLGRELEPFVPGAGERIGAALATRDAALGRALFAA
jgi:methionyl-tRNA synthetase